MPSYIWDRKTGRYRDTSSNRFVPRSLVLKFIDRQERRSKAYMQRQARRLVDREISLPEFQRSMAEEIKGSHIRMGLLASGGKDGITNSGYGSMGNRLREEYGYLNKFVADISQGKLTRERIIFRAGLYGNSSTGAFYRSEQISRIEGNRGRRLLAKRSLDPNAQHCVDCPAFDTNGKWILAELVVPPTRRCACRNKCRCTISYKLAAQ